MAKLFGREYTKAELLRLVGDVSQICGVKIIELQEGRSQGVKLARFWTGSGLEFDVNLSRGMGIGAFRYKGMPLAWMSSTGDVAPEYYDRVGGNMDRSYAGGLMHNSGLRNVGSPNEDDGEELGLHGRIANLPAENICADDYWDGDDYYVFVSGRVRETTALGENMILRRKVTVKMGSKEIFLEDTVENAAPVTSPHMILYHTNYGFPLIEEGTRLVIPSKRVVYCGTDDEVKNKNEYAVYTDVSDDADTPIYFHDTAEKDGWSGYAIANDKLGLGIRVDYLKKNLNNLVNWVDLQTGRNVVEVGPSNCTCLGRAADREAGRLQFMEPGEVREYKMKFGVLDGDDEIAAAEKEFTL